jgi:ubiquilin
MADEETPVTFNIKGSDNAKYVMTLPLSTTVLDLKNKLSTSEYADLPADRQRLIYSGRVLKDVDTLETYKVKDGNTLHLVKGAASNQRQNPASQGPATTTPGAGSGGNVPSNIAAGTGNNPLAGLTGARYAGHVQLPGAGMFGPDGGVIDLFDTRKPLLIVQLRWVLHRIRSP